MADFFLKQNDTSPALEYTLSPLTNLSGASVVFNMTDSDGVVKVNRQAAVVDDAVNGVVQYLWQAADTDTAGLFLAEFEVTFADATVETFPNATDIGVSVAADSGKTMTRPLTDAEVEALRKVLEKESRRAWLFGSIRASSSWIVITLGGIALGYESVVKALRAMLGNE